ncbi:MAG: alpha/beta hydrolase [Spirochaetales bacterium]|nr:alpha/beta hydrolase [Spirochaetales bacterium]
MNKNISLIMLLCLAISLFANGMQEEIDRLSESVYRADSQLGFSIEIAGKDDNYSLSVPAQALYFTPLEVNKDVLSSNSLALTIQGKLPGKAVFNQRGYQEELDFKTVSRNKEEYYSRAQEKVRPERIEEEVELTLRDNSILSGTLTKPIENEKNSLIIFISGSGSQDRDSYIANHKPFQVLSDYLITLGYPTLRFDDRGVGKSTTTRYDFTTYDLADDVIEEVNYVSSLGYEVILMGHSEGAIIAAIVSSKLDNIKATILLAPPAVEGKTILADQNKTAYKALGLNDDVVNTIISILDLAYDAIIKCEDEKALEYLNMVNPSTSSITLSSLSHPWYRAFLALDPKEYISNIKCPCLALIGTNDKQVSLEINKDRLEEALKMSKIEYKTAYPEGVNHMLQYSQTGDVSEYGIIDETVNENVLIEIKEFLCTI